MIAIDKILKVVLPIATIAAAAAQGIAAVLGKSPSWLAQLAALLGGLSGALGLNNARRALNQSDPAPSRDDPYFNPPT